MERFICKECKDEFPEDGFYYQKHRDTIRRSLRCKKCESARAAAGVGRRYRLKKEGKYVKQNRTKYSTSYYERHREEIRNKRGTIKRAVILSPGERELKKKEYRNRPEVKERNKIKVKEWRDKHPNYAKEIRRKNKEANPNYDRKRHLQRYGMTLEDYDLMVDKQNGACAVCGRTSNFGRHNRMAVDHCHATDIVRGLLCQRCNLVIGEMEDSPDLLRKAAKYLEGK